MKGGEGEGQVKGMREMKDEKAKQSYSQVVHHSLKSDPQSSRQ